jgi:N-acetylglucosaminyl-diphospho-decaprenol L-rhamnosyltransferase
MALDVFVVNYNTSLLLDEMFYSLRNSNYEDVLRYLIVDNASSDDSVQKLRSKFPVALLLTNNKNVGFGRANNQLIDHISGEYVLLLNTDAFVAPDTILKTIEFMKTHPDCGVLGVRLIGRDGELQPSCRYFPTPLNVFLSRTGLSMFFPRVRYIDDMNWDHASVRECDWVPGCYYLIRHEVIDQVGLFDPRYFLYYEEVDHCKRVREAGWKVVYYPHTSVVHVGGESAKSAGELSSSGRQLSALQIESELLYFRKHHGRAGLAMHIMLVALGDALLAIKGILKVRGRDDIYSCWSHAQATWRSLLDTRFGTQSTK